MPKTALKACVKRAEKGEETPAPNTLARNKLKSFIYFTNAIAFLLFDS